MSDATIEEASKPPPLMVSGNAGLRLLDACYDDVAYARYLLRSRLPSDRNVRTKINWKDQQSGSSLLHCLSYSDLSQPIKLLLDNNADPNLVNHVSIFNFCCQPLPTPTFQPTCLQTI
eukprot:scaffold1510_cov176-Ochromonas_danica.AAC.7